MTVSWPPEAGLLSLKWSSSNLSNLSTHPSMNQGRQAQGGQTPVIECTCRHKYLVRQARAGQTRTQANMKLAMTTWQPVLCSSSAGGPNTYYSIESAIANLAASQASIQQGVQYVTDELRAGQNAAKGRQQTAPTSSRRALDMHQESPCIAKQECRPAHHWCSGGLDQNTGSTFA